MNDKQQLAAMGEHLAEQQPMCMDRRIEELEAQVEKLTNRLAWRNTGSPNGLRRFMTHKQYAAQTPGVQTWYEPIRYEAPEGWQLVPVDPTEEMCEAGANAPLKVRQSEKCWIGDIYASMLASAPSPDTTK